MKEKKDQGLKSLSLPWAWHSSAPACFAVLLFYSLFCTCCALVWFVFFSFFCVLYLWFVVIYVLLCIVYCLVLYLVFCFVFCIALCFLFCFFTFFRCAFYDFFVNQSEALKWHHTQHTQHTFNILSDAALELVPAISRTYLGQISSGTVDTSKE